CRPAMPRAWLRSCTPTVRCARTTEGRRARAEGRRRSLVAAEPEGATAARPTQRPHRVIGAVRRRAARTTTSSIAHVALPVLGAGSIVRTRDAAPPHAQVARRVLFAVVGSVATTTLPGGRAAVPPLVIAARLV